MKRNTSGITLVEILIVIAILGVIVTIAVPHFERMIRRGDVAEAKSELRALQAACENYYIHNSNTYPSQLSDLTTATPNVIGQNLPEDPFSDADYGYNVSSNGYYYVIYSIGPDENGSASVDDAGTVSESSGESCIFVSNSDEDTEP